MGFSRLVGFSSGFIGFVWGCRGFEVFRRGDLGSKDDKIWDSLEYTFGRMGIWMSQLTEFSRDQRTLIRDLRGSLILRRLLQYVGTIEEGIYYTGGYIWDKERGIGLRVRPLAVYCSGLRSGQWEGPSLWACSSREGREKIPHSTLNPEP